MMMGEVTSGEPKCVDGKLELLLKAVESTGDEVRSMSANLRELVELVKAESREDECSSEKKGDDGGKKDSQGAGSSSKKKEEKKDERKDDKKDEKPKHAFYFPYYAPVSRSSGTTIERFSASLQRFGKCRFGEPGNSIDEATPIAVSIGPYHHGFRQLREMEQVKRAALEEFRLPASKGQQCDAVHGKILSLVGPARRCYAGGEKELIRCFNDDKFADMMFLDGWFLLQFMVSMCPDDRDASPEADPLMRRAEVHTRIGDIARDLLLLENQVPWLVLQPLMDLWPAVPVDAFLRLMASAFVAGNQDIIDDNPPNTETAGTCLLAAAGEDAADSSSPPPHLLGLFYRRQVGAARTQSLRVPRLSSMSSTAVELAEMGVKLKSSSKCKTNNNKNKNNMFGDMAMSKRRVSLITGGELSLTQLVLNDLTACWLINMAAYEECLGATQADNYAVGSYIAVLAMLMNRKEDVQELRNKGVINSAMSDRDTLGFFKGLAPHLHVGHRYYHVFQQLEEYKHDRWLFIAVHRFLYNNIKTILAVLSGAGVLAGLFKTILSLKHPSSQQL